MLLALVAGGDDHDDPGLPGLLDRVGEQVALVAARRRAEGEVEDADVQPVVVAVRDDPADRGDDRAERRRAVGAGGLDVDQARARGDAAGSRSLGSSPAMIPATCVPCPKVSRWARSRSRLWLEKSGPWTTLPWAASAGTGTMPVSITATSTPLPVAPDWSAPIASRTSASVVPGVAAVAAASLALLSAQPLHRAVDDDGGHAGRRAEGALGAGRHLGDESVDDGQRLPDRAAVALDGALRRGELVGLGAHDHRLQRAVRGPAREEEQRDRGQCGHQRDGEQQSTATIVVAIPTNSPHHVHETSSGSPRRRSFGAWSAYRSALRARLDTARRSYECAETVVSQRPAERAAASLAC